MLEVSDEVDRSRNEKLCRIEICMNVWIVFRSKNILPVQDHSGSEIEGVQQYVHVSNCNNRKNVKKGEKGNEIIRYKMNEMKKLRSFSFLEEQREDLNISEVENRKCRKIFIYHRLSAHPQSSLNFELF